MSENIYMGGGVCRAFKKAYNRFMSTVLPTSKTDENTQLPSLPSAHISVEEHGEHDSSVPQDNQAPQSSVTRNPVYDMPEVSIMNWLSKELLFG